MKQMLMITGCSNSSFWYAGKVGAVVDYLGLDRDEYITREPSGFVNIVKVGDAEVVDVVPSAPACAPAVSAEALIYRIAIDVAFNKHGQVDQAITTLLEREAFSRLRDMLIYRKIDAVVVLR